MVLNDQLVNDFNEINDDIPAPMSLQDNRFGFAMPIFSPRVSSMLHSYKLESPSFRNPMGKRFSSYGYGSPRVSRSLGERSRRFGSVRCKLILG